MIIVRRVGLGRLAKFNSQVQYNHNLSKASEQKLLDRFLAGTVAGVGAGGTMFLRRRYNLSKASEQKLLDALLAGTVAGVGASGTMFMRRRRSKNGKMIVEQVRR